MKLTDAQIDVLKSATRDPEGICLRPEGIKGGAVKALVKSLILRGFVTSAPATDQLGFELWRIDGRNLVLRITDEGLRAIGAKPQEARAAAPEPPVEAPTKERRRKRQAEAAAADAPDDALEAAMEAQRNARAAEAVARIAAGAPRVGRAFWRAAEEAAARGDLPPAPDLSAPTHAPYRRKFERLLALAEAGDAAGLRAVPINPISTTPKALARWRDLAVRAIETRGAGR